MHLKVWYFCGTIPNFLREALRAKSALSASLWTFAISLFGNAPGWEHSKAPKFGVCLGLQRGVLYIKSKKSPSNIVIFLLVLS